MIFIIILEESRLVRKMDWRYEERKAGHSKLMLNCPILLDQQLSAAALRWYEAVLCSISKVIKTESFCKRHASFISYIESKNILWILPSKKRW